MTTARNFKSTWELAGRLGGSFETSTRRATSQLATLRKEYRQNQSELKRMQGVMRTAAVGTTAYSNAARAIPRLKEDLTKQAFAISDVEKEALGASRSQGRMANASGRAGSALRALSGFGLAAGAAIGVAAGAVTVLAKALNSTAKEAQRLQTLSVHGVNVDSYQKASSTIHVLTGSVDAARQAVASLEQSSRSAGDQMAHTGQVASNQLIAASQLGFENWDEYINGYQDVAGMIATIRDEWAGANEHQRRAMRGASQTLGIQPAVIDSVAELHNLEVQAAEARRKANQGDLAAAAELKDITEKIARANTTLGNLTPDQIKAAEKYDEVVQHLGLAVKDLKLAVTSSFADDMTEAAKALTTGILKASELWDKINGTTAEDGQSWWDRAKGPDRAVSGFFDRQVNQRLGLPNADDLGLKDIAGFNKAVTGFFDKQLNQRLRLPSFQLPGFANGGVVPGATGRPMAAVVHGGERVLPAGEQRQSADRSRVINQTNNFQINGASSPMATGEEVVEALRRQLAGRLMW